ncbi:MAG: penicillin-binding protein 2 [Spongiibacteraceae bacterium]
MAERITLKDPYHEMRLFRLRMAVASLFMVLLFGVLIARYFHLQVIDYEKYRTESDRNRVQLLPIAPRRGLIYDRHGELLADNLASFSLDIVKERVDNLDATIERLRSLVKIDDDDVEKFRRRLRDRRPYQPVPLKLHVSEEEIAIIAINRFRLPGVQIDAELARYYPEGELFAHALGYVGRISDDDLDKIDPVNYAGTHYIGKLGVERFYEDQLHGKVGYQNVETNARGRVLRVLERTDPEPGQTLRLFLDAGLQRVAAAALAGELGAIVAIDPNNGGVLAQVSTPSFDPNLFVNGISGKDYRALRDSPDMPLYNRTLQGTYPPGSTIKPMYALAGLHYGAVTPFTRISDPGFYMLPGDSRQYRDWKRGGHGTVDLKTAVAQSCDVYFYDLARKLTIDKLHDFSVLFGLGSPTGIDNTHERSGIMPSREWKRKARKMAWYPGETLSAGIGQGYVLTTPLQLAVMTSVIANRGERFQPRLVHTIGDKDIPVPAAERFKIADPAYWDVVIDAMQEVVHGPRGTGKGISRGLQYHIAGKTGTAQVVGYAQGIKYDASLFSKRRRDHALFIAFAPVEDPQIAIAIIVENGEHGASTAAPIARKMFDNYLLGADGRFKPEILERSAPLRALQAQLDTLPRSAPPPPAGEEHPAEPEVAPELPSEIPPASPSAATPEE